MPIPSSNGQNNNGGRLTIKRLTVMEELRIQFTARLKANNGKLVPLAKSVPPSPTVIARLRRSASRSAPLPRNRNVPQVGAEPQKPQGN